MFLGKRANWPIVYKHCSLTCLPSFIFAAVMQAPAYILAGVIIYRLFKWRDYKLLGLLLTFICCMFVDAFFNKLALSMYQPQVNFSDPCWVIYNIAMCLGAIVLLYIFWREYSWGIVFALIPFFDTLVIGLQHLFHFNIPFYEMPWIHFVLNDMISHMPPFNYMNMLPDNRNNPLACMGELLLIGVLVLIYRAMVNYRKNIHF